MLQEEVVTCSDEAAPAIGKNVPVFYGLNEATTSLALTPLRPPLQHFLKLPQMAAPLKITKHPPYNIYKTLLTNHGIA
jgi:hypothetical protein